MNSKTMSHNVCYVFSHLAAPLSFNTPARSLGFESFAYGDVIRIKYRFFCFKGLYWYSIILENGYEANSLFFSGLPNCVRDFRSLCDSMDWAIEDSSALSDFVAYYMKSNH